MILVCTEVLDIDHAPSESHREGSCGDGNRTLAPNKLNAIDLPNTEHYLVNRCCGIRYETQGQLLPNVV